MLGSPRASRDKRVQHPGSAPPIAQPCAIRATRTGMRQALKLHPDSLCLRNDTHRSGRRTSPRRQPGVILFRYRQDKRFANTASNSRCGMPMSFGGTLASKHSSAARGVTAITNSTLRPRRNGQHIGSAATEAACALRLKSARPGSKCSRTPGCTRCKPRSTWIGPRACGATLSGVSVSRRCSKKRAAANHIGLLRTRRASRISIIPFASRTKFLQRSKHEVWH